MGTQIAARGNEGRLFLPSGLGFLHGNDSTWMFWIPYGSTSMLEIVPKDDEEGYDRENSEKD